MAATLQGIFRSSFSAYASAHKLPLKHLQAAHAIMSCRTAEQGGHVQQCPDGHEAHIQYHSCRHRSCPKCNALPKAQWAEKQFQRLLAVDHYHVIFTLPHELLLLWRYNQRWFADTLFHSVSDTLLILANDSKHLGALPGMILSLHTWGRNLTLHPHIHCLITGGGLAGDGHWRNVHHHYLFPAQVVRAVYQGKVLSALWRALRGGELHLPPDNDEVAIKRCLKSVARKKWNVRIQPPYSHGRGVMSYLARYVKGGPISNHRLISAAAGYVRFGYQDHRDGKQKTQQLGSSHFIERILDHVAEPRQHVIRHYGLYGHQAREKRNQCRGHLGQAVEQTPEAIHGSELLQQTDTQDTVKCRECGKRLVREMTLAKNSYYKLRIGNYVQQDVRANIETSPFDRAVPPDGPPYFFVDSMSLN